jgi:hypothetical protein
MVELPTVGDRTGCAHARSALIGKATALANELPAAHPGSLVAFAFEHDHAEFLVALAAVWQRGHDVALPHDARRYAVGSTLQLPEVRAFVHDTGAGTGLCVPHRPWPADAGASTDSTWPPLGRLVACRPEEGGRLQRTELARADLQLQVALFGTRGFVGAGDRLLTTYAPGHLPALVPGLLGPLQNGASIVSAVALSTPQLLERLGASGASHLLSSPDRLRELARCPAGALASLRRVFTLGVADPTTTAQLRSVHGLEVVGLGSTNSAEPPFAAALFARPDVDDVAFVQVASPAEPAPRWFVVVAGRALPRAELAALTAAACPGEPAPVLTTVERLARDVNGQLPASAVLHACGRTGDGRAPNRTITWSEPVVDGCTWRAAASLPGDFAGFEGHFFGHPVLSGAVQLHDVVLPALRAAVGHDVQVAEYGELKFLARIQPGETLDVQVELAADRGSASFVLQRGLVRCTTGKAAWGAP